MLDRAEKRFDLKPRRLAADTAYGTGKFLGWLVKEKKIIPHIPVWEMSDRQDGIFSRSDFRWDRKRGAYICPNGKLLKTSGTVHDGRIAKLITIHDRSPKISLESDLRRFGNPQIPKLSLRPRARKIACLDVMRTSDIL